MRTIVAHTHTYTQRNGQAYGYKRNLADFIYKSIPIPIPIPRFFCQKPNEH